MSVCQDRHGCGSPSVGTDMHAVTRPGKDVVHHLLPQRWYLHWGEVKVPQDGGKHNFGLLALGKSRLRMIKAHSFKPNDHANPTAKWQSKSQHYGNSCSAKVRPGQDLIFRISWAFVLLSNHLSGEEVSLSAPQAFDRSTAMLEIDLAAWLNLGPLELPSGTTGHKGKDSEKQATV